MKCSRYIIVLMFAAFMCGCASILSKSDYRLRVTSSENGALVKISSESGNHRMQVRTPTTVSLPAGDGFFTPAKYRFEFSKDGFKNTTIHREAKFDPWWLGNLGFGGLIGALIVDPLTGAMWRFDEKKIVYAPMEKNEHVEDNPTVPANSPLQGVHDLHDGKILSEEEFTRLSIHLQDEKQQERTKRNEYKNRK